MRCIEEMLNLRSSGPPGYKEALHRRLDDALSALARLFDHEDGQTTISHDEAVDLAEDLMDAVKDIWAAVTGQEIETTRRVTPSGDLVMLYLYCAGKGIPLKKEDEPRRPTVWEHLLKGDLEG